MKLSDVVLQRLLTLVESRDVLPGQKLPAERRLAEQLGVSRASLREAIQKLVSQGVLESRHGDGTYVKEQRHVSSFLLPDTFEPLAALLSSDPEYRYDVLEARMALESATAWHAALRATTADKDRIRHCFDVMLMHQKSGNRELSSRADAQFHLAIAQASHNVVLLRVMHGLFELVLTSVMHNRNTMFMLATPEAIDDLTVQHASLLEAIVQGDAAGARDAVQEHLAFVRDTVRRYDDDEARQQRYRSLPDAIRSPVIAR
ncbi:transcriptional regulator LldR [Lampropedia aestuarii]|uniref:transcriptional regulator LldR n=1 Tax=Lampropedia aestuarii TaxID=2562762 RepID=UPI002469693A|nr:transcriptional regulator LldR [Lampropedia aestuarii]MDH5858964.1 transcriptional regulator LldR [Lampropedia aestuarii]